MPNATLVHPDRRLGPRPHDTFYDTLYDTLFEWPASTMGAMDWFGNNWPILLVALALFIIGAGLMRKIAKLAFVGVALGAVGLFLWPIVSETL